MKVKYTSSKWFLENNGEWIEIAEKDWEKVRQIIISTHNYFKHHPKMWKNWLPTPDTEYQLDGVGFEIEEEFYPIYFNKNTMQTVSGMKKVAHLKVDQNNKNMTDYEVTHLAKHNPDKKNKDLKVEKKEQLNIHELSELLAVMHRDGGHHEYNVGTVQAIKDAHKLLHTKWAIQEQSEVERMREDSIDWTKLDLLITWLNVIDSQKGWKGKEVQEYLLALKFRIKELESKLAEQSEGQDGLWKEAFELFYEHNAKELKSKFKLTRV